MKTEKQIQKELAKTIEQRDSPGFKQLPKHRRAALNMKELLLDWILDYVNCAEIDRCTCGRDPVVGTGRKAKREKAFRQQLENHPFHKNLED